MDIHNRVKDYILENYLFTSDASALNDNDSFLEKGILDSTGMLEVIHFIEKEFGIKVTDEEMTAENLDSVARLSSFIMRKIHDSSQEGP